MRDAAEIRKSIPHSFPFLMLDRVVELIPGKFASAVKRITAGASFTPASPLYPQVFLIEGMAQLAAVAAAPAASAVSAESNDRAPKPESGFLAAVTDAKFHKRPVSGDEIKYSVEFEAAAMGLARFKGRAEIDGELAAEGILTFSVPGRAAL
jgi:3-hydroxyacyl-[acyl-carrier-protein] dehydratase